MRFPSGVFERLVLLGDDEGAGAGAAGATRPALEGSGQALQLQVPASHSAAVEATKPALEGAAAGTTAATPARSEPGQFTQPPPSGQGAGQQQPSGQPVVQASGAAATLLEQAFGVTTTPAPRAGLNAEQLGTLRGALIEANPHAVPELIRGESFEELIASVPVAREAHSRVAQQVSEAAAGAVSRGGGAGGGAVDPDSLSGEAKIGVGLQQRRAR